MTAPSATQSPIPTAREAWNHIEQAATRARAARRLWSEHPSPETRRVLREAEAAEACARQRYEPFLHGETPLA